MNEKQMNATIRAFNRSSAANFAADIAAINDRLVRLEKTGNGHSSSTRAVIASRLFAVSPIDGIVEPGDILVTAMAMLGMGVCGGGMGLGSGSLGALVTRDVSTVFIFAGLGFCVGCGVGGARSSLRLWRDIGHRPDNNPPEPEVETRPVVVDRPFPVFDNTRPTQNEIRMIELPNGQAVEWGELCHFLRTAVEHCDTWKGKSWAREAWTGKEYAGYPQLGSIKTRQWVGIKSLCRQMEEGYTALQRGIWRTNDQILIENVLDVLDD